MPFPEYVPVRTVTVGGAMVLESAQLLKVQVTVTASRSLVWDATGYRFERMGVTAASELGSEVAIVLPRTDVQGWKDAATGQIIDVTADDAFTHRYVAQVRFTDDAGRAVPIPIVTVGPFVLPEGDGPIDLDKMVPASTVAGETVSIPDWWSTQIAAAEQYAQQAQAALIDSAEFVGKEIGMPGSPARRSVESVLADDPTVVDAAAMRALNTQGVVTGRLMEVIGAGNRVWGHAAQVGPGQYRLMGLGYDGSGHLDDIAVDIFREDIANRRTVEIPGYGYIGVAQTANGLRLLDAERLNGDRVIPGLQWPEAWGPKPGAEESRVVLDYPGVSGSFVRPHRPRPGVAFLLGSSTFNNLSSYATTQFTAEGWDLTNLAKGGEDAQSMCWRFGSYEAAISGSGEIPVAAPGLPVSVNGVTPTSNLRPFDVTLDGVDGVFRVAWDASQASLTITQLSGSTVVLDGSWLVATPVLGPQLSDATAVLNIGKNNSPQGVSGANIANACLLEAIRYLTPLVKQVVVVDHFMNRSTNTQQRAFIDAENPRLRAQFGASLLSLHDFVLGDEVWAWTGKTKTPEDEAALAEGQLAPSLSKDAAHMDVSTERAFVDHALIPHILASDWKVAA